MDTPHRRILRVVRQSEESTTCELPAGNRACGSCRGCSFLSANGVAATSDPSAQSSVKVELPSGLIPGAGTHPASNADSNAGSARVGVREGDFIVIEAPASLLLALSSVFYLAPAILMLFFSVCCSILYPNSEALVAVSAAGGLSVGLGVIIFFGPALRSLVTRQLIVRSNI